MKKVLLLIYVNTSVSRPPGDSLACHCLQGVRRDAQSMRNTPRGEGAPRCQGRGRGRGGSYGPTTHRQSSSGTPLEGTESTLGPPRASHAASQFMHRSADHCLAARLPITRHTRHVTVPLAASEGQARTLAQTQSPPHTHTHTAVLARAASPPNTYQRARTISSSGTAQRPLPGA